MYNDWWNALPVEEKGKVYVGKKEDKS